MIETITRFYCDCCKKEIEPKKELGDIINPLIRIDIAKNIMQLDICRDCAVKIRSFAYNLEGEE